MSTQNSTAYRENKQHGSALFPFNIYPCCIPGDFPSVPLHWQGSMELIYIKKGAGVCGVGLHSCAACAGDIFILPPGRLHSLGVAPGGRMEYENIIFTIDFLGCGAADICAEEYLVPLSLGQLALPERLSPASPGYAQAAACLQQAEALCEKHTPGWQLGVKAALLQFLFLLLDGNGILPPHPESADTLRLKTVLQQVEERSASGLTVAQAAAACGLSSSHFMRWFKQAAGVSFTAYVNDRRLAAAAEALRQSDATILAVAQAAGFDSLSNFNRQFKRRYARTPSQYRAGI